MALAEELTNKDSTKTYIEIPNRLFLISKRGYGGWNKGLDKEEELELIDLFKSKGIECHVKGIESMFRDEERKEDERCNSRVILRTDDAEYTIQNYNIRCLKHETAVKIASFLIKKGLNADIEVLQGFSGSKVIKSVSTKRNIKKKEEEKSKHEQVHMFAHQTSSANHTN